MDAGLWPMLGAILVCVGVWWAWILASGWEHANQNVKYPWRWHMKLFYHCRIAPIVCFFFGHHRRVDHFRNFEGRAVYRDAYCRRCHESMPED